ncbi:MAG: sigma-70 family RNA polymerase sigma factor [Endomicrobiales bacterium]
MKKKNSQKTSSRSARPKRIPAQQVRELAHEHERLVATIASRFHTYFPTIALDELIAEGNRGLFEAAKRYDASRKVKFSTYAWFWIMKNMKEYVTEDVAIIDIPRSVIGDVRKVTATIDTAAKQGKQISPGAIARQLDMTVDEVRSLINDRGTITRVMSIDKYLNDEDRTQTIADVLADPADTANPGETDSSIDSRGIRDMVAHLSPVERSVIELRFGLRDSTPLTLKDIALKLKLNPAKVRDIESVARLKLRKLIKEHNDLT